MRSPRRPVAAAIAVVVTVCFLLPAAFTESSLGDALPFILFGHLPGIFGDFVAVANGRTPGVDFASQYAALLPYALWPLLSLARLLAGGVHDHRDLPLGAGAARRLAVARARGARRARRTGALRARARAQRRAAGRGRRRAAHQRLPVPAAARAISVADGDRVGARPPPARARTARPGAADRLRRDRRGEQSRVRAPVPGRNADRARPRAAWNGDDVAGGPGAARAGGGGRGRRRGARVRDRPRPDRVAAVARHGPLLLAPVRLPGLRDDPDAGAGPAPGGVRDLRRRPDRRRRARPPDGRRPRAHRPARVRRRLRAAGVRLLRRPFERLFADRALPRLGAGAGAADPTRGRPAPGSGRLARRRAAGGGARGSARSPGSASR